MATLAERDTKGLYGAAAAGRVTDLTGVGDPYEPPPDPDVHCISDGRETAEACAERILAQLGALGFLAGDGEEGDGPERGPGYRPDEEDEVRARLAELGYIE